MPRRVPFPAVRASLFALGGLVVLMAAVLVFLPGGSATPGLDEVAALADRPATGPPPPPGAETALGWRATGSRGDRVGDRATVTVRYARGPARAALTVVGGDPLRGAAPAGAVVRDAGGRTLVVTGTGVDGRELVDLAAAVGGEVAP